MSGYNTGFTFNGGSTAPSITNTQVGFGSVGNTLTSAPTLTYNSVTGVLTSSLGDAYINSVRVGLGNSSVSTNTVVGTAALGANTTGASNTAIGYQTLDSNTTGAANTAIGNRALAAIITSVNNTAVGSSAGQALVSNSNTAIGTGALTTNNGASGLNTAVGVSALGANLTGSRNVAIGNSALNGGASSSTTNAVAVGYNAGGSVTTANSGTYVGYSAGAGVTSGNLNIFLGSNSGNAVTTGSANVIIGSYTGSGAPILATGSNFLVLSNGLGIVDLYFDNLKNMYLQGSIIDGAATPGTTGQVLTSNGVGAVPTWQTAAGAITLANSTTNATFYPAFSSVATGSVTTEYTNTSLTFNPSSGSLTSTQLLATGTGNSISLSSTNNAGQNNILSQNVSDLANSYASITVAAGTSSPTVLSTNSSAFNAAPTLFSQVNSMSHLDAGTNKFSISATGGINLTYSTGTKAYTVTNTGEFLIGSTPTVAGSAGTVGQVLTSGGPGQPLTWTSAGGGLTLATSSTNSSFYVPFSSVATGAVTTEYTSPKISFNPNTGTLSSATYVATAAGTMFSGLFPNTGGANSIFLGNSDSSTGSSVAFTGSMTGGGGTVNVAANASAFNASPTTFLQVNSMSYLSGTAGLTVYGPSGVNLAYGAASSTRAHTINSSGALLLASTPTVAGNAGTAGQVLTSAGAGAPPTWAAAAGSLTLANSTTSGTFYIPFSSVATGSVTTEYTNLSLSYDPSTNILTSQGGDAYIHTVRVGLGAGANTQNLAIGGGFTLSANTTGAANTAVGYNVLSTVTTATGNTGVGYSSLNAATGGNNTAVGYFSGLSQTTATSNTAIGWSAMKLATTGSSNTAIGTVSMGNGAVTGGENSAIGYATLLSLTSGSRNTAVGNTAGQAITGGSNNTALGYGAMIGNATGSNNIAIGYQTLGLATIPVSAIAIGYQAMGNGAASGINNIALGNSALLQMSTATNNTAIGNSALTAATTGGFNTAVGAGAGAGVQTGTSNVMFGAAAGSILTGSSNTLLGTNAGSLITTGNYNTIIGASTGGVGTPVAATNSNLIVLADGQANVPVYWNASTGVMYQNGQTLIGTTNTAPINTYAAPKVAIVATTQDGLDVISANGNNTVNVGKTQISVNGTGASGSFMVFIGNGTSTTSTYGTINVSGTGTVYGTTSDARFKENVVSIENGIDSVKALNPVNFDWKESDAKGQGFIAQEAKEIVPLAVIYDEEKDHYSMDYSRIVPVLTAAIKEQQAIIETLLARLDKAGL